jgi:hypothetical protein
MVGCYNRDGIYLRLEFFVQKHQRGEFHKKSVKNFRVTDHLVNEQNVEVKEHLINVGCSNRRQKRCLVLLATEHLTKQVQW